MQHETLFSKAYLAGQITASQWLSLSKPEILLCRCCTHPPHADKLSTTWAALAWLPELQLLASGSEDKMIRLWCPKVVPLWEVTTGKLKISEHNLHRAKTQHHTVQAASRHTLFRHNCRQPSMMQQATFSREHPHQKVGNILLTAGAH